MQCTFLLYNVPILTADNSHKCADEAYALLKKKAFSLNTAFASTTLYCLVVERVGCSHNDLSFYDYGIRPRVELLLMSMQVVMLPVYSTNARDY